MGRMTDEELRAKLISGKPIKFIGIKIVPFTLDEIFDDDVVGLEKYSELLKILNVDKASLDGIPDEQLSEINNFDLFTAQPVLMQKLIEFLTVFLRTDQIGYSEKYRTLGIQIAPTIGAEDIMAYVDRDNFDEFMELFKKINCVRFEKAEKAKPANAKALEMMERIKKNALEEPKPKKQGKFDLTSLISGVCSKHPSLNYTNVFKLNVFTLWEAYYYLSQSNQFDSTMQGVYTGNLSPKDINFEDISWIKKINTF